MSKIWVINCKMRLSFAVCLLLISGTIYAQQNEKNNPAAKSVFVSKSSASLATDNCTMWFDGDYRDCCRQHDADYLTGGDNWRTRLQADNHLFLCIAGKKGIWHLALAPVMWTGVRIFGSDFSPSSRRNVIHKFFKRAFVLTKKPSMQPRQNQ